jgi:hypothetical protein
MSNESAQLLHGKQDWPNINISPTSLSIVLSVSKWIVQVSHQEEQVSVGNAQN